MEMNSMLMKATPCGIGILCAAVLLVTACQRTVQPPTSPPKSILQGKWLVTKYIITNFDTAGGYTALISDTVYPSHSDYWIFTADSVYVGIWETWVYTAGKPHSLVNKQTNEYSNTAGYSATANYYIYARNPIDTTYILQLSDTTLITKNRLPSDTSASRFYLFDIYAYAQRQ